MEKKGEYVNPGFDFLKNASDREFFYLDKGLTVSAVREIVVQLINIDEKSVHYYFDDSSNSLLLWFKNLLKDRKLSMSLKNENTKEGINKIILDRISELNALKLKKFEVNISKQKLLEAEYNITNSLSRGIPYFVIREDLIAKGWSSKIVDLILESDTYNYRNFTSLYNLSEVNSAYQKFEDLKKKIIIGIAEGISLKEIVEHLKNLGWSDKIINYLVTEVFSPNNTLTKIYWYIIKEVNNNQKNLSEVKAYIIKSGRPGYVVDNLINRFNPFENDLDILLDYLKSFDSEEKNRVKNFLTSRGWDEPFVERAINNREQRRFWNQIVESLDLENDNSLRYNTEIFRSNILKFKNTTSAQELWEKLLENYKKIELNSLLENEGELHVEKDYVYYYPKQDIDYLMETTKKNMLEKLFKSKGYSFYYSSPIRPLLCNMNKSKFLIASKLINRPCVSCKVVFPINKMTKLEMWDVSRTHKVTKYVCKKHENMIASFIDEDKFVQ